MLPIPLYDTRLNSILDVFDISVWHCHIRHLWPCTQGQLISVTSGDIIVSRGHISRSTANSKNDRYQPGCYRFDCSLLCALHPASRAATMVDLLQVQLVLVGACVAPAISHRFISYAPWMACVRLVWQPTVTVRRSHFNFKGLTGCVLQKAFQATWCASTKIYVIFSTI